MIYYDREGNPLTDNQRIQYFSDEKYKRVKWTELPDGTVISTVWLGLPHGHGPNGPIIFETMTRRPGEGEWAEQYRYATEEEAVKHHDELVSLEYHANEYNAETRWNQIGDETK